MFDIVTAYIDPTGGLPPSMWGAVIAGLVAGAGTALTAMRLWGRAAATKLTGFSPWHRTAAVLIVLLTWGAGMSGSSSGRSGHERERIGDGSALPATPFAEPQGVPPAGALHGMWKSVVVPPATGPRVVILAFDGLDPNLVREYVADGRMPHFARMMDEGTYHPLATVQPPQSPVAWSSFITGERPEKHGVFDFIRRDPATYRLDLSLADRRTMRLPWSGTPFWELPRFLKYGATALRLPMVFPPPKGRARILAGMGVWDVRGTEGTYAFYSTGKVDPLEKRGFVSRLRRTDRGYAGDLPGPYRAGEADSALVPFTLTMSDDRGVLRLHDRDVTLPVGRWSGWVETEFRMGFLSLTRVPAVTRMLLKRDGDEISLYVSPFQLDPRAPLQPISSPRGYAAELAEKIGLFATRGMPFDTQAVSDGVLSEEDFLAQADELTAETERMLAYELGRFHSGTLFAYFEASDVVQHLFWRCIDREHPLYAHPDSQRHRDAIPRAYAACDRILGETRAAVGDDTAIVALSDHGFGPYRRSVHLNAVLRELGFLTLRDERRTSDEIFQQVDWNGTRAYASGFNALHLNRAGRERDGIVTPDESDALCRELERLLTAWTDPETGEHPIASVSLVETAASHAGAPDALIGYARGYRASWQTALGAVPEATVEANRGKWSGDHCVDCRLVPGIFLSSDRRLDAASLEDVGRAVDAWLSR